jgi:hypothetical protein
MNPILYHWDTGVPGSEAAGETGPTGNTPTQNGTVLLASVNRHGKLTPDLLVNGDFRHRPIYQEVPALRHRHTALISTC